MQLFVERWNPLFQWREFRSLKTTSLACILLCWCLCLLVSWDEVVLTQLADCSNMKTHLAEFRLHLPLLASLLVFPCDLATWPLTCLLFPRTNSDSSVNHGDGKSWVGESTVLVLYWQSCCRRITLHGGWATVIGLESLDKRNWQKRNVQKWTCSVSRQVWVSHGDLWPSICWETVGLWKYCWVSFSCIFPVSW